MHFYLFIALISQICVFLAENIFQFSHFQFVFANQWHNLKNQLCLSFSVQKHPEHEKFYRNNLDIDNGEAALYTVHNEVNDVAQAQPLIENRTDNIQDPPVQETVANVVVLSPNKIAKCATKTPSKPAESDREFNVVRFAKIYDGKKKAMLNAIQQKEREQRLFHSKPAPNFHAIHAAVERKRQHQPVRITCPKTPSVLRRHEESKERLQKQVCNCLLCYLPIICQSWKSWFIYFSIDLFVERRIWSQPTTEAIRFKFRSRCAPKETICAANRKVPYNASSI